jgi:hypothetical protein
LGSPGQPLDRGTRDFMGARFGHDFSRVRVHTDARAAESVRAVNSVAYTVGNDIAFGTGRYVPGTQQGQHLLAHELTHVVQQSGQQWSRIDKLDMTKPGDRSELEADAVAKAIVVDGGFPSPTSGTVTLARQPDAGLADAGVADAGVADAGPRDAGPIGGAAAPAKAPVVRPSVAFGKVAFDARADRIPPSKTVDVPVVLTGIPSGSSAAIDVEGSGGANGTATLTAGASLATSGNVTLKGGSQTSPGNAGKLKLRATLGTAIVGQSSGFTVAAWPTDYTDPLNADIDSGGAVGLSVKDGWSSDGSGSIAELDEVKISERVDLQSRDNPPFTVVGAISAAPAGGITSGYLAATALTVDSHTYSRADINTVGITFGPWSIVYGQLCIFKCRRTGVVDLVMPKSGYRIAHTAWKLPMIGWAHMARKFGTGVTVEGRTATAGSGDAFSQLHVL